MLPCIEQERLIILPAAKIPSGEGDSYKNTPSMVPGEVTPVLHSNTDAPTKAVDDSIFWSVDISSFKDIFSAVAELDIPTTDVVDTSNSVTAVSITADTCSLSSADPMPTSLPEEDEQYELGEFLWDALINDDA
jgi:hypothetical protein